MVQGERRKVMARNPLFSTCFLFRLSPQAFNLLPLTYVNNN